MVKPANALKVASTEYIVLSIETLKHGIMKKIAFILALLSCIFMGVQCEKDDDGLFGNSDNNNNEQNQNEEPTLPPATQSGKGTFGCKVNGEVWVPEAPPNINELHAGYQKDEFFITAQRNIENKNIDQTISLGVKEMWHGVDSYTLKRSKTIIIFNSNKCDYETDSLSKGRLIITYFDSAKRIVSGRFRFKLIKKKCDTLKITNGRFDIKKGY